VGYQHPHKRKRQKPCGLWRLLTVILSLIGSCIDHLCLSIKLRVGRILDLPAEPWLRFQVAPSPLPLAEPASDSDGCPSSSFLRLCRRSPFEFPRTSDAFDAAGFCGVPGFPGGFRLLLQRLRYGPQVAPRAVPPALPVMDRRVAPILASFGGAGCESSRLPLRFAPPVSPTISIQVAPDPHPPAPAGQLSESPRIRSIRFALFESPDCSVDSLRTSSIDQSPSRPGSCSLNVADSVRSESPRNFLPQLIRICFRRLRLLPHVRLCR